MQNFIKYLFIIVFLLINNFSFPQELSEGELEVKDNAYEYFENKNFHEALPLFSQLLSLYPKNPEYNYFFGVCLIQLNKETEKAVKYLEFACKKNVNPDVYFFLAKAYHLNYRFDDAIKYYNMFKEKGKKSQVKEYQPDRQIKMCNNGKDLIRYISELTVLENKQIKDRDFYRSYEIADFGGIILNNPFEFKTKIDRREKDNSILFLSIERNVIYLSSYGKNKKNGKDIYCVTRLEVGKWGKPENLGKVINTTYDEAFPYIHPDGKTLYFSSKGHNSMGGYDIFRSIYDSTAQSWTEPVNLDFPTNSPYDDILFISDAQEEVAYFASNRETGQENISVYKILIDKNPVEKELHNLEEIALKSKLALSPLAEELAERIQSSKVSKPQVTPNFYNYNDSLQFFPVDSNQRIIADFYNYNKNLSIKLYKKRTHTFAEVEHTDDLYDDNILVQTKSGSDGGSEQTKIHPDKDLSAIAEAKADKIPVQNENIDAPAVALAKADSSTIALAKADSSAVLSPEYSGEAKVEADAKADSFVVTNAKPDKSQEFKKELSFDKELDDESQFVEINKNVDELKSEQITDDTKDEYLEVHVPKLLEAEKNEISQGESDELLLISEKKDIHTEKASDIIHLSQDIPEDIIKIDSLAVNNQSLIFDNIEKPQEEKIVVDMEKKESTITISRSSTITVDNKEIPGSNSVKITNITELNGLLYTIQIGAYKNPVESSDLLNLDPIYKEQTALGFTRYTTGNYSDYIKALSEKDRIIKLGIKDAFVVAYYNGKRISISEAAKIK